MDGRLSKCVLTMKKRSKIEIGDEIEFTNTETNEELICEVIKIYKYNSFEELYKNHNKISIGYKEDETANPNDMLMYYSKDNIDKYGVLGIEITLKWQSSITTKGCELFWWGVWNCIKCYVSRHSTNYEIIR